MRRTAPLALLLVAGLVAGASAVRASTVLRFELEDLCDRADVIAWGTVTSKECRQRADGAIVTDLRIETKERLKGAGTGALEFTVYGGIVGQRGSAIAGSPTFEVGEETLVFLDEVNAQGCRTVIGLAQGKYTIRIVEGRRLAFRDLEGLKVMDPKTGSVEHPKPEQGIDAEELLAKVRRRVAEKRRG